jgi:plasmid stabilization system protein ParE
MQIEFTEPASIELDDAFEYYELQLPDLGKKFFNEILETIELISQFPKLFAHNSKHTRKAVLRKFPYNLIYSVYKNKIFIIAVAHQNRAPEYWIDRL